MGGKLARVPVAGATLAAVERILHPINGRLQEFKAWFNAWRSAIVGPGDKR